MACMPARYDFSVYEGADCKALQTTLNKDITGATIAFSAAPTSDASSLTLDITGVIDAASTGKFHIPFSASDTDGEATGEILKLKYDVFSTIGGETEPLLYGTLQIHPKVKA